MTGFLRPDQIVKSVQKKTRFLRLGKITHDVYALNVIINLVGEPLDCIEDSLADLSPVEMDKLVNYARSYFAENGFEPHPVAFMVSTADPTEVERKRQEMRPKYERLMDDLERTLTNHAKKSVDKLGEGVLGESTD